MIWAIFFAVQLLAAASAYPHNQDDDTIIIPEYVPKQGQPVDAPTTTKQLVFIKFSGTLYPETLRHLSYLESLVFQDSKIEDIRSGALCSSRNIKRVVLNLVELQELTYQHFEGCRNLKQLEIRYRNFPIASNAFQNLRDLETLETTQFRWGELKKEYFTGMENIKKITITTGEVSKIESGTFEDLGNMERLVLSNNKLTAITGHEFRGLKDLQVLNVDANPLASFDIDRVIENLPKLKTLFVSYALLPEQDWEYIQRKAGEADITVNHY